MKNLPTNLTIDDEPNWRVKITGPDGVHWLSVRGRDTWKRLTAINHARYFARRNPTYAVLVHVESGEGNGRCDCQYRAVR